MDTSRQLIAAAASYGPSMHGKPERRLAAENKKRRKKTPPAITHELEV